MIKPQKIHNSSIAEKIKVIRFSLNLLQLLICKIRLHVVRQNNGWVGAGGGIFLGAYFVCKNDITMQFKIYLLPQVRGVSLKK